MTKRFLAGVGLSVILLALQASPALAETLQDSVLKAVKHHPSVERAKIGSEIAQENVIEQRSGYFPEISANLGGGRLYGDNSTSRGLSVTRGAGYSWLWEGTAALNQKVFDWNVTTDRVASARAQQMAALYGLDDAKQGIAYSAVQAYIELFRAQQLFDEAEANLASMQGYQTKIKNLVAGGGADEAEALRASDFVLLAKNKVTELKGQVLGAEAAYIEAVGEKPQSALHKPLMPFVVDGDTAIEELITKIQGHHPQILALTENSRALEHDADAEGKSVLPVVNSEMSYTKRDQRDLIGGESEDARAMLRLSWSLETGGAQFARQRRALHQQEEAQAQIEEMRRAVEKNLRIALAGLEVAKDQLDNQKTRYDEAVSNVATYRKQFEASKRTMLEVMQADSQAFDAKVAYVGAEFAVIDAAYGFLMSQGRITDAIEILASMEGAGNLEPAGGQTADEVARRQQAMLTQSGAPVETARAEREVISEGFEVAAVEPDHPEAAIQEQAEMASVQDLHANNGAEEAQDKAAAEDALDSQVAMTEPSEPVREMRRPRRESGLIRTRRPMPERTEQAVAQDAAVSEVAAPETAGVPELMSEPMPEIATEIASVTEAVQMEQAVAAPKEAKADAVAAVVEDAQAADMVEAAVAAQDVAVEAAPNAEPYAEKDVDFVAFRLQNVTNAQE